MNASSRCRIVLPLVTLITAFAFSAQAQNQNPGNPPPGGPPPGKQGQPPGPGKGQPQVQKQVGRPPGPPGGPGFKGPDARFARGEIRRHDFGGHAYRGRLGWEQGRWHHEVHNGRDGWWWDVGGVWYFYPQPMDGPPAYVSEDFADDVVYAETPPPGGEYPPPGPGGYPPPGAYGPPPGAYPPPPPPPPDPAASAVGGAVVGGLLGGLLTGRASGAAAGAVIGGATGAIAGATAASRAGYWLANGECYYRYPSGQYVQADPRWCY
jgi:hypothetical protein